MNNLIVTILSAVVITLGSLMLFPATTVQADQTLQKKVCCKYKDDNVKVKCCSREDNVTSCTASATGCSFGYEDGDA